MRQTTTDVDDGSKRAQLYVWMALFNLFLALIGTALLLWCFVSDREVRQEIAQRRARQGTCEQRVLVAPKPMLVDPHELAPPQDRPKDGYFGKQGTEIRPAQLLSFEVLRSGRPATTPLERLRLGSPEVLPTKTIHVVNLWATWCEPCRDEMPDFKAMFARRADWGAQVRFLPIQIQDDSDPERAYGGIERIMPPAPIKLADRAMGGPLATALAADTERTLFRGQLPVTLLLDCNRRVRWGHFTQLASADIADLERVVDQLREELADTSPGAWCSKEWPGNGRCEGKESTAAGHVLEDCGELKRRPQDGAPEPVVELPPMISCPEGTEATPEGRCKRKLRGTLPNPPVAETTKPASCGNGACDAKESSATCCEDCPCEAPLVCKDVGGGPKRCMVKGLRGG
ncbi:MAG: hypothetical protein JNK56_34635 [Myxococcales bacterium]|nr:hypothetical protein [Myxococcales bacterium]